MPSYNASNHINSAVYSILNQTYKNWELLIIDDCSIDDTSNLVKKFCEYDSRIRSIFLHKNEGVANARNVGLDNVTGDVVAFCDADDIWLSQKLEVQLKYLSEYKIVCSDYVMFNDFRESLVACSGKIELYQMLSSNRIPMSSAICCREIVLTTRFCKIGHEDYVFWLNIFQRNPNIVAYRVKEVLVKYRRGVSLSSNKFRAIRWQWEVYRNFLNFGFFRSLFLFFKYALINIGKHSRLT